MKDQDTRLFLSVNRRFFEWKLSSFRYFLPAPLFLNSNWFHPLRMDLADIWRSGWTQNIETSSIVNQTTNSLINFSILSHILLTLAHIVVLTRWFDGRLFLQLNVNVSNDVIFQVPTCGCNRTSSWSWLHVTSVTCSCGYLKIKILLRQSRTDSGSCNFSIAARMNFRVEVLSK